MAHFLHNENYLIRSTVPMEGKRTLLARRKSGHCTSGRLPEFFGIRSNSSSLEYPNRKMSSEQWKQSENISAHQDIQEKQQK